MTIKEIAHTGKEMQTRLSTVNIVVAVRIDLHVKLLSGLYQSFAHFHSIA